MRLTKNEWRQAIIALENENDEQASIEENKNGEIAGKISFEQSAA